MRLPLLLISAATLALTPGCTMTETPSPDLAQAEPVPSKRSHRRSRHVSIMKSRRSVALAMIRITG